jgi:energy-coupling factor transporter ATP-binding protein EcfA2
MMKRGIQQNWDFVLVVDGREGSGKSTLAMHIKALYDGSYNLRNVLFDASRMLQVMQEAPKGSCVLVDEAIISLYKREALKDFQTTLVKAFSIVRARSLLFILVLPNYFDLDPNIRTRANYRLYAYAKRGIRGYLDVYQPKRTQWTTGSPYQELIWRYKFPVLPEKFQSIYDEFKEQGLMDALRDFQTEVEEQVRASRSREEFGRKGTKIEKIYSYLEERPDATSAEVAREVRCSPDYARKLLKVIREEE